MLKLIAILVLALALQGCFLDTLCGTQGDDDQPAQTHRAPAPNPPTEVR
jgi:hypothetical protein